MRYKQFLVISSYIRDFIVLEEICLEILQNVIFLLKIFYFKLNIWVNDDLVFQKSFEGEVVLVSYEFVDLVERYCY